MLVANLLSVYVYAAEYKLTSKYNLDSVFDDNWLGIRDDSTAEKEEVYGGDLTGIWELGYRQKNSVLNSTLSLRGAYRDYQDYDNVDEKASLSYTNVNEKNKFSLFANHNRIAARNFTETLDATGQLDISNVELVTTDFGFSSKHALNEKHSVDTALSVVRRDVDSKRYSDYSQYGSSVTWKFLWTPTFSPQINVGYSEFRIDDSDPVEIPSPFISTLDQQICDISGTDTTFFGFGTSDCKKLRQRDSTTAQQTFRLGGVYIPTEKVEINFLVGKVLVDQEIEDDITDLNLSSGTDTTELLDRKIKTDTTTNSYDVTVTHKGIRSNLSLNANLGERIDSVGNLTETTRIALGYSWKVSEKSSIKMNAYWTNEDYDTFSSDDDREIDRYNFVTSYTYRFLKEWSMAFKYFYIQTDNDLVDGKVERNRVRFSILWRPKDTIWSR